MEKVPPNPRVESDAPLSHARVIADVRPHDYNGATHRGEARAMTSKELYPSLVQLIINAETVSWNRFYNFLMFNTVLVLAWATVWVGTVPPTLKAVILVSICVLGGVSGIFWAALGYRGRAFLYEYAKMAADLEAETVIWPADIQKYKPLTKTIEMRDSLPFGWAGSRAVLVAGPLGFSVLYGIMLCVSLR